jgi:N-acetylneuraminate synthase
VPIAVLQCTTAYPCPPERVGLNLLPFFRERYRCPVGLSDHSGTIFAGLAAIALGCDVLEVHVTLSREMFGPDVPASVTTAELRQLVEGVRFVERMRASPVDKDAASGDVAAMRQLFTKSLVARVDLAAGTVLRMEHLSFKKPGTGIPSERIESVLGRPLRRAVARDHLLTWEDLDGGA